MSKLALINNNGGGSAQKAPEHVNKIASLFKRKLIKQFIVNRKDKK